MPRGETALALALAFSLLPVAAVQADRKATVKERRAVARVLKLPPECARVRISTVTKKPKWASVSWRAGRSCEPYASDGVAIVKKRPGSAAWRFVTAGSDFECPALYALVPRAVAEDLAISCR